MGYYSKKKGPEQPRNQSVSLDFNSAQSGAKSLFAYNATYAGPALADDDEIMPVPQHARSLGTIKDIGGH